MLEWMISWFFGRRCRNHPYGCKGRVSERRHVYCEWCLHRGLFDRNLYETWTKE